MHPHNFLLVLLGTFAMGTLSFRVKLSTTVRSLARPHVGTLENDPSLSGPFSI